MKPRTNWLKLILIAFVIAVICITAIRFYAFSGDQRSEQRSDQIQSIVYPLVRWMLILGVVGLVIVIFKYIIKSGIEETKFQPQDERLPSAKLGPPGFPIVANDPDGPGQYRVQGVHRQTKMDISQYIQADSAANAQVKAELEDIVVTSVRKVTL
jgi:hypothetical protein